MIRGLATVFAALAASLASPASAKPLTLDEARSLDRDIETILRSTALPSASIAIVRDGEIAYVKAYRNSRLHQPVKARPDMRYAVGSISKQFTATAVLMLAEEGKLSLDHPIDRYLPGYTSDDKITIRRLLNHSAGYADYWPIDYTTREQMRSVAPTALAARYATGPLDFQPGEDARYCNTCYIIAGLIIEKVTGQPLDRFLQERVFRRAGINDAVDIDIHPLSTSDATGYTRYAFGPIRQSPISARGWLFATGALAMRADDLARWDIAMLNRRLLTAQSYEQQFTAGKRNDGRETGWGLGVQLAKSSGHKIVQHSGTVPGFTGHNRVYPDDRAAIVVLTNADVGWSARDAIVDRIAALILPTDSNKAEDKAVYDLLREGKIDAPRMTSNAREYFTPQVLADYRSSLRSLGEPIRFTLAFKWERGGFIGESYNVDYPMRSVQFSIFKTHDGKYEQAIVIPPG